MDNNAHTPQLVTTTGEERERSDRERERERESPPNPPKTYSQAASPRSKFFMTEELLSDSEPLWSAYIVGHFMGDAPHIGKVHFISPKTILFRIDNLQHKARVLKRNLCHNTNIPIVVREWSPKIACAHPDLSAVPLWVDLKGVPDHLFSHHGLTFFGD
ncbi:hypothetical protein N665_0016s0047 [Sinapis alba]|nr:hypothetical protein N665_0016s0047 [Sinapis alba]